MTRLVRRERTGDVHVTQGPTVRSQGRMLVSTACGSIIAGPQHDGSLTEVTCDQCAEVSREAVAGRGVGDRATRVFRFPDGREWAMGDNEVERMQK